MKRRIRIKISANGKGLTPYSMELELRELPDHEGISQYKKICEAVNLALGMPAAMAKEAV